MSGLWMFVSHLSVFVNVCLRGNLLWISMFSLSLPIPRFPSVCASCHLNGLVSRLSEAITNANTKFCRSAPHYWLYLYARCCVFVLVLVAENEPLRLISYDCHNIYTHNEGKWVELLLAIRLYDGNGASIRWANTTRRHNRQTDYIFHL